MQDPTPFFERGSTACHELFRPPQDDKLLDTALGMVETLQTLASELNKKPALDSLTGTESPRRHFRTAALHRL